MTRTLKTMLLLAVVAAFVSGCSSGQQPAESQGKFGVRMARMNLWREALFRFSRAVEMNPGDAMAQSNLAVAYEANGDFEKAAKHYREAMRLDKTNPFIQKNYSRYVEFSSRDKKRQQKRDAARTASATTGGTAAKTPVPAVDPATPPPVPGDTLPPPAPPAPAPAVAEPSPPPPQKPRGDRS